MSATVDVGRRSTYSSKFLYRPGRLVSFMSPNTSAVPLLASLTAAVYERAWLVINVDLILGGRLFGLPRSRPYHYGHIVYEAYYIYRLTVTGSSWGPVTSSGSNWCYGTVTKWPWAWSVQRMHLSVNKTNTSYLQHIHIFLWIITLESAWTLVKPCIDT